MQLAGDFELRRFGEQPVEWYDLTVVVERCHCFELTSCHIDDPVAVHCDIGADHVQRSTGHDSLYSWIDDAVFVCELEPPINGQRPALPYVGEPHRDAGNELTAS